MRREQPVESEMERMSATDTGLSGGLAGGGRTGFEHAHHVFLAHDEQFLAVDLDGLAGILAEDHLVTDFQLKLALRAVL